MLDLMNENDENSTLAPLWLYADGVTNLKNHSKRQ